MSHAIHRNNCRWNVELFDKERKSSSEKPRGNFWFSYFSLLPWGFWPYIAKIYQVICQNYLFTYFLVRGVLIVIVKMSSKVVKNNIFDNIQWFASLPTPFSFGRAKFLIEFVNKPRKQSWKLKERSLFPYKLNCKETCRWDVSLKGANTSTESATTQKTSKLKRTKCTSHFTCESSLYKGSEKLRWFIFERNWKNKMLSLHKYGPK